jgi:hypothetical protein
MSNPAAQCRSKFLANPKFTPKPVSVRAVVPLSNE